MKFSYFSHVWAKPGMTPHDRYEQLWRELELCDEVGFDHAFCVEHHFRPDESWMSSPSLFTTGGGVRTKNLRIGPMGYIPALYDPLRLVEEIAIIALMAAATFSILDTFVPSMGQSARTGAGFGIGANLVGFPKLV